jgi:two-component system response regulator FixJ
MDRDKKQVRFILVVDDDPAVRESTARILEFAGHRVAAFDSGTALIDTGIPDGAELILLDIMMPGLDGLETLRLLREQGSELPPVVILTGHGDIRIAVEAMKLGAVEVLEKPYPMEDLLELVSVHHNFAGFDESDGRRDEARDKVAQLSPRQREVLKAMAVGEPSKVTAHRLELSVRTVETYRGHVFHRLGIRGMADAVRTAVVAGLLDDVS